jgi:hypothetical protein
MLLLTIPASSARVQQLPEVARVMGDQKVIELEGDALKQIAESHAKDQWRHGTSHNRPQSQVLRHREL